MGTSVLISAEFGKRQYAYRLVFHAQFHLEQYTTEQRKTAEIPLF